MNSKILKIIFSSLVGATFYMLFGWIVFEYFLGDYMETNTTQVAGFKKTEDESSMLILMLSCLAYSTLLSLIYEVWTQIRNFKGGLILGALMGILIAIMTDSYWYSTSHFFNNIFPIIADVLAAGITVGMMGGVIGWFLGWKK